MSNVIKVLLVVGGCWLFASIITIPPGAVCGIDKGFNSEVKKEVVTLVRAVKAYEREYSKYPIESDADCCNLITDEKLMGILLGTDLEVNPKGMVFYEGKEAREGKNGLIFKDSGNVFLVDPWGRPYHVVIDTDYSGSGYIPGLANDIRLGVVAYSLGEEGVLDETIIASW